MTVKSLRPEETFRQSLQAVLMARLTDLSRQLAELRAENGAPASCGDAADRSVNVDAIVRAEQLEAQVAELQIRLQAWNRRESGRIGNRRSRASGPSRTVTLGSRVTLSFDGEASETYLLAPIEQAVTGQPIVTPTSPLGRALLSAAPADRITYRAGTGRDITVTVLAVDGEGVAGALSA